jgi:hypothetical protein
MLINIARGPAASFRTFFKRRSRRIEQVDMPELRPKKIDRQQRWPPKTRE